MAYDERLATAFRRLLADTDDVAELKMFGGWCATVAGNMAIGVLGDDLIVRVGPKACPDALSEPGVREFDFSGRPMVGWVFVDGAAVRTERHWIVDRPRRRVRAIAAGQGAGHARSLAAGRRRLSRRRRGSRRWIPVEWADRTAVVLTPMRLTLVRHATILIDMAGTRILIDPAFDPARSQPPVDGTPNPVPNPARRAARRA